MLLDTKGQEPRVGKKDLRLYFKYEACWSKDLEANDIIRLAWLRGKGNVAKGVDNVRSSL